jgi:hypothetical protein
MAVEPLETRRMLSALPNPAATPTVDATPQGGTSDHFSSPDGYTPQEITGAYGINNISFNGIHGNGSGQTIAIIVAYDDPQFVDSTNPNFDTSDLYLFDQQFGLPNPPSFIKVNENGGTTYPGTNSGWASETALDVEWTHAIAPAANIVLIECDSTNLSDLIEGAAQYAEELPNVSVITMSFAVSEFMGETSYDSFLTSPTSHGITFVAASGDNGDQGGYPADSPDVVAVGATQLDISGDNYVSETASNTSGGGISQYETKPAFQYGETQSSTFRTTPDVSIDGYSYTGASVYDSFNGGSSAPWYNIGGTSMSAPIWASLIAIADQGRASVGLGTLDGATQTLPKLYSLPSSDYHEITSGNNGYPATAGYNLVTGLGTPIANELIPALAGGNSVAGTIFADPTDSGHYSSGDAGLGGVTVFDDLYNSGVYEGADQETTSNSQGQYDLSDLPGGTYKIVAATPAGYERTTTGSYTFTGSFNSSSSGDNFGFKPTSAGTQVKFASVPATVTAGVVITPSITVDVDDSSGDLVASDNSTVTLSLASGPGGLGGTLTAQAVDGVATFSGVTLSLSGIDTLQATDGSLTSATSGAISVTGNPTAPAGSHLVFSQQPTNANTGAVITPAITVDVENPSGQIITTDGSPVTLSIGSGPGTLGGTLTENSVDGVATFSDITLSTAGSVTLNASDGSLSPIASQPFTILAIPTQLSFGTLPTGSIAGETIVPFLSVDVLDGGGNLVTTDGSTVSLTVASGPGTLGGTTTATAVNGVATFSNLTLSTSGSYTLTATDGSLTAATSGSIPVAVPGNITPTILRNTLPDSLVSGGKVKAVVVVNETNSSSNISSGFITTNIFATTDGAQTLLGTLHRKVTLKAGKSTSVSIPITSIPAGLSGSYTIQAQSVDTAGNLQNVTGASVKIAAPFISLTEAVTKLTLPSSVLADSAIKATAVVKVTNAGNVNSAGITTVRLYASTDGTAAGGTLIGSLTRSLTIKPGLSTMVTVPITQIPAGLSGTYSIVAEVTDPNAVRTEVNTGNTVKIAAAYVTLGATLSAPSPASAAPGKSVNITVTITNTGNVPSTGAATINLGLTSDRTTELAGSVSSTRIEKILPGKPLVLKLKLAIPATLSAGSYFPYFTFDQPLGNTTAVGTTAIAVT